MIRSIAASRLARSNGTRGRLSAFALVALAVGSGIAWFILGGAPTSYSLVNAGALLLVGLALALPAATGSSALPTVVAIGGAALLLATFFLDSGLDDVHRWVTVGPLRLHAGMIVLPAMLAALAGRRSAAVPVLSGFCALVFWRQPDTASALALVGGTAGIALARPASTHAWLAIGIAAAGFAATIVRPDTLAPVPFVETALGDAWRAIPILGIVMAGSLAAGILLAPRLIGRVDAARREPAHAVTGTFLGYASASLVLDHPQPLIGYGASPILGMALALAVLRLAR